MKSTSVHIFIVGCTYRGVGVLRLGRKSQLPKEGQSGKLLDEGPMGSQWLTHKMVTAQPMASHRHPTKKGWLTISTSKLNSMDILDMMRGYVVLRAPIMEDSEG